MDDQDLNRALMMAGLAMMQAKGNPMSVIGQGGMFAMQDMNTQKVLRARLLEEEQQAQARQALMARQQMLQKILTAPQPAGSQPSMADAPGWKPQVAPRNVSRDLLSGGFIDEAKKYAEAERAGQDEVFSDVRVGEDGVPYLITKSGKAMPLPKNMAPREGLHFADTGAGIQGLDKFTGAPRGQAMPKSMSPAEQDARRLGWANFGLSQQRELREGQEKPEKAPPGYRWTGDGNLEPIRGGPATKPPIEYTKQQTGIQSTVGALESYKKALEGFGLSDMLSPDKRAGIGTLHNNALLQMKEAYNLGVLNGPDYMLMLKSLTDPTSMQGVAMSREGMNNQIDLISSAIKKIGETSAAVHNQAPKAGQEGEPAMVFDSKGKRVK